LKNINSGTASLDGNYYFLVLSEKLILTPGEDMSFPWGSNHM